MDSVFGKSQGGLAARLRAIACSSVVLFVGLVVPATVITSQVVAPTAALAQDDEEAAEEEGGEAAEGESMLVFFYNALGVRYTIVFLTISFAFVAVMVMIVMQLRRSVMMPPGLPETFEAHLNAKEFQQAFDLAKADDSYLGHQLAAGMGKLSLGYPAAVEAMQDAASDDTMKLEHKVSYVALIGALAPMFGLLGTVDGMVASFMKIAQATTAPKPKDLAMGIATALITTLVGLWLAIPAIGLFAMFKNWLQRLTADADAESMRLMSRFQGVGKK